MGAPQDDRDEAITVFLYVLCCAIYVWSVLGALKLFN